MPANSSWRSIELQGNAPWGFRLTSSTNQIQPGLQISKVSKSTARSSKYTTRMPLSCTILFKIKIKIEVSPYLSQIITYI